MSAEYLFQRNLNWAYSMQYDLNQVHSPAVVEMINTTADHLLLDAQLLSVGLRIAAAHHEDVGCVQIANSPDRSRSIVEFNLLIANAGSGKSTIINSLIGVAKKKRIYDTNSTVLGAKLKPEQKYRHGTVQEFTAAGIVKALNETGNLFVVIDEFDGNHQTGMFLSQKKHHRSTSIMTSLHTGLSDYQKIKASENIFVSDPHVCFLGASNGAPILDIIRYKLKNSVIPDPMVMRTVFDSIRSTPKLNAEYAQRTVSVNNISWELFLLTSSLLTNQTFTFEHQSNASANSTLLNYMDSMVAAASMWDGIDQWYSSRFAKTCELVARIAAQLAHIDQTMEVLRLFITEKRIDDSNTSVSYERYHQLKEFVRHRYPSSKNVVIINERQVKAAIYTTQVTLLKYFNLFDIDSARSCPLDKVPLRPPGETLSVSNITNNSRHLARTTNTVFSSENEDLKLKQSIMTFESIAFTRTMLYKLQTIRSNIQQLDQTLNDLVASQLLRKCERSVLSANSRTDIYIKCLPTSLEQDTIEDWTKSVLNRLNLSWSTYIDSCSTLRFPSKSARFVDAAKELLETIPYKNVIRQHIKPSRPALNDDSTSIDAGTLSSGNIDQEIQSEHVLPPSASSSLSANFQSTSTTQSCVVQSSNQNSVSSTAADVPPVTNTHDNFRPPEVQSKQIDNSLPIDLSLPRMIDICYRKSIDRNSTSALPPCTPSAKIGHDNILSQRILTLSANVSSTVDLQLSQTTSQEFHESSAASSEISTNAQQLVTDHYTFQNSPPLLPSTNSSPRPANSEVNRTFEISNESSPIRQQLDSPALMLLSPCSSVLNAIDTNSPLTGPPPANTVSSNDAIRHARMIKKLSPKADEQHSDHESEDDYLSRPLHIDLGYTESSNENEDAVGGKRTLRRSNRLAMNGKKKKMI